MDSELVECKLCEKKYQSKFNKLKHDRLMHQVYHTCDHCSKKFVRKEALIKQINTLIKHCRFCFKQFAKKFTRIKHEELCEKNSNENNNSGPDEVVFCEDCGTTYKKKYFYNHQRSVKHMNRLMKTVNEHVEIYDTCFNDSCAVFKVKTFKKNHNLDSEKFLSDSKEIIQKLIELELIKRKCLKFRLSLLGVYHRIANEDMEFEESIKHFNSDFHVSSSSEQFLSQYEDAKTILLQRNDDFNSMYSGWGLLENSFILVTMYTYQMKFAGSYIPTPKALRKRNALVNIKNECNRCFLYCVLYHFYSSKILNKKDKTKAESYDQFMKNFNYGDLKFPFNLNDICKFEKLNTESDISINVYSYKSSLNFEVKLCEEEKRNHIG